MTAPASDTAGDDGAVPPLVPDRVEVEVPFGGRVVVVSDIHLGDVPTGAATHTTVALAGALAEIDGPGVLVIAGDGFEMLACPPDIRAILDAHPDFVAAVHAFATGEGHSVIVLPGNHDGQLAWDADAVGVVIERLGAETMAMSCDLVIRTGVGERRVRVVHGNQDDPFNRFVDVRAPLDTPLGHHVVREILPRIDPGPEPGALLEDINWLNDTDQIAQFIGSRLLYRKIVGRLWLIAVPFAAAVLLRLIAFLPGIDDVMRLGATRWLLGLGIAVVFIALVAAAASIGTMLRVRRALAETGGGRRWSRRPQRLVPRTGGPPRGRGVRGPDHRPHPHPRAGRGRRRVLRQQRLRHPQRHRPPDPVQPAGHVHPGASHVTGRDDRRRDARGAVDHG
ncbi:MAG: metallophosphoesterase [Ilumatobacteraceae bacterium]